MKRRVRIDMRKLARRITRVSGIVMFASDGGIWLRAEGFTADTDDLWCGDDEAIGRLQPDEILQILPMEENEGGVPKTDEEPPKRFPLP